MMRSGGSTLLNSLGALCMVVAVAIGGAAVWDVFFTAGAGMRTAQAPGLTDLDLAQTGIYVGLIQHRGPTAIPSAALSKLEARLYFKDTAEEISILMNPSLQPVRLLGAQGLVLFNFLIDRPGPYLLSLFYPPDQSGPRASVLLIPQPDRNPRQTLMAGAFMGAVFVGLGIFLFIRARRLSPPSRKPPA